MNQPVPSAFLLEKYLNDQCTDQEKELVERWYASIQGKTDYLNSLSESDQARLQDETFTFIKTQIERKEPKTKTFSPLFGWISGVAAALVLGFGFYFFKQSTTNTIQVAVRENIHTNAPADTVYFENDEPRMIMHKLPDGSTVWMHADASIAYPKVFEKNRRMVKFDGEGFFDIAHDKTKPFIIQSGEVKIKVLGTRFNVKARQKRKMFEVAVVSGSVSVSAPGEKTMQEVILKPQQKAFFEPKSKRLTLFEIPNQARKEIFEPVTILFEETPIRSVIHQLEQRFDTHILLVNPDMAHCKVTADFEQQSLPVILEMLCTSLEASYNMSENTILIDGKACK